MRQVDRKYGKLIYQTLCVLGRARQEPSLLIQCSDPRTCAFPFRGGIRGKETSCDHRKGLENRKLPLTTSLDTDVLHPVVLCVQGFFSSRFPSRHNMRVGPLMSRCTVTPVGCTRCHEAVPMWIPETCF